MTPHIVKNVRVTGDLDRDTTLITLNGQTFAFSSEVFDRLFFRVCERKAFKDALKKVVERTGQAATDESDTE